MSTETELHMKRRGKRAVFIVICIFGICAIYVFSYAPAVALLTDPLPKVKYYHWELPRLRSFAALGCPVPDDVAEAISRRSPNSLLRLDTGVWRNGNVNRPPNYRS